MEVLIISRSLRSLETKGTRSSSELFELQFSSALASCAEVNIISMVHGRVEKTEKIALHTLRQHPISPLLNIVGTIRECGLLKKHARRVILFFGYDPLMVLCLTLISKLHKAKVVSFTFDSHVGATENKRFLRRNLLDMYFNLGARALNLLDAVLLFNELAYNDFSLKIPCHVTRVGCFESDISRDCFRNTNDQPFRIMYAGSLERYNGIHQLLGAFRLLKHDGVELIIYGQGYLVRDVIAYAQLDPRVVYKGVVEKQELEEEIKRADLLINLRDPAHHVSRFAFPSKVIQYMASGIPVLSSRFVNCREFNKSVFLSELAPESIVRELEYIMSNPQERQMKANLAKAYLRKHHLWSHVIKNLYDFLVEVTNE